MGPFDLRRAYRRAHARPEDLTLTEAADAGFDVRAGVDELENAIAAHGVWRAFLVRYRRAMVVCLLTGAVIAVAGPVLARTIAAFVDEPTAGRAGAVVLLTALLVGGRFGLTVQSRLLVYRMDYAVRLAIFRRLLHREPGWAATSQRAVSTLLQEYPGSLSQMAFVPQVAVSALGVLSYSVALVAGFGWTGLVILVLTAAASWAAGRVMERMNASAMAFVDADHRRSRLVDVLARSWQSLRRTHLDRPWSAAMDEVRSTQITGLRTMIRRQALAAVTGAGVGDLVLLAAAALALWGSDGLSAGRGIGLVVLVRLLVGEVGELLGLYGVIGFTRHIARDVEPLFLESTPPTGGTALPALAPGERVLLRGDAEQVRAAAMLLAAQDPRAAWVGRGEPALDGPIAENVIVWTRPVDIGRYRRALTASGLGPDLAARQAGDGDIVSDAHEVLSDGQLARLSVARALYADPSVVVLDDVLAPLDPDRAAQVAADVLAPDGPTRVVIGEQAVLDRHVDRILTLRDGGWTDERATAVATPRPADAADGTYAFPLVPPPPRAEAFDAHPPVRPIGEVVTTARALWTRPLLLLTVAMAVGAAALDLAVANRIETSVADLPALVELAALVAVALLLAFLLSWLPRRTAVAAVDGLHRLAVRRVLAGSVDGTHHTLSARLGRDFFALENRVPGAVVGYLSGLIALAVSAAAIASSGWVAVVPLLIVAAVGAAVYLRGRDALAAGAQLSAACRTPAMGVATRVVGTPGVHRSGALRAAVFERYSQLTAVQAAAMLRSSSVQLCTMAAMEALGVAVLAVAVTAVVLSPGGALAPGVVVYAAFSFSQRVAALVESLQSMDRTLLGVSRVAALLGAPSLPPRQAVQRDQDEPDGTGAAPSRLGGGLVAEGIQPDIPNEIAPAPVDLRLEPGEWAVVTGPSGIGKSTLLRGLAGAGLRAGTVTSTTALVVDSDLPDLPLPVDALAPPGPLRQLCEAADVPVPEGPIAELSHAHRQVVALARAAAAAPPVLLLDEATSALPSEAEGAVLRLLRQQLPQTSVVAVMHRPDHHGIADTVVALERQTRAG